jgi:hypothetical protein
VNLLLIDTHLILSYLDAPFFDDVDDELHRLVLEHLLRLLLVEVIVVENLLHQFSVDVRPLALHRLERLAVQQLTLNLILRQVAFVLYVVHHLSSRV